MQTQTARTEEDTPKSTWDGKPVAMDRWGKSHMSVLIYIENRNVDGDGKPRMAHMRCKPGTPRRGKDTGHIPVGMNADKDYPSILKDELLSSHDDWDCVDDLAQAGLVLWEGTGVQPTLRLTSAGWTLAGAARRHLATTNAAGRRTWAGFDATEHVVPPPSQETIQRAHDAVVGGTWTKEQLLEVVECLRNLQSEFYWMCFHAGVGGKCHPFMEFNGIMSKYIDLCRIAAEQELPFPAANIHSGVQLPMANHDLEYFAEKFACIFGPFFRDHPEKADLFCDILVRDKEHG